MRASSTPQVLPCEFVASVLLDSAVHALMACPVTLLAFGFPKQFVHIIMELYTDISSDPTINHEIVTWFPVSTMKHAAGMPPFPLAIRADH